ncbi:MAG: LPS export ABC transporter periplasmic protein LptC [Longimicrobiales bacterium]
MMMTRRMLTVLTVAGLAGSAGACEAPTDAATVAADLEALDADQMVFDMVSFLTASGVREGRVEADTAYVYNDSATVSMRRMRLVFYTEQGRERATVTSDAGTLDQNTDRMVARGNVVLIVHADGRRIESPELNYDPGRDRLWSDSTTVQTMPDGTVTRGSAFESDLEFRNVQIRDPRGTVTGIVF